MTLALADEKLEGAQSETDGRPRMVKVTMNLTEYDEENANYIERQTNARSKAQAVSTALSLTRFLIQQLVDNPGMDIVLKSRDETELRVAMAELENIRARRNS